MLDEKNARKIARGCTNMTQDKETRERTKIEDTNTYTWKSEYKSWYPSPKLTLEELTYLYMIQKIFRVKYPSGEWKHIKLTNHQAEFHKNDLAIQKYKAKNEVVIKSRGTSFTTNAIIRLCMNAYSYNDQLPPVVRINDTKVKELFENDFKDIIRHMTPIIIKTKDPNTNKEKIEYMPFNNQTVTFETHEIYIPDRNIKFTAYPANTTSSENIRGNRINFGLMDETNYIQAFQNVDTAMLDASRGSELDGPNVGKIAYQATYGTTRKGRYTSFNTWLENLERMIVANKIDKFRILKWPALDPTKVDLTRPLTEQTHLIPIAPWQTLENLEQRRALNLNKFKEEYMAMLVDDEGKLYNMQYIVENLLTETPEKHNHGYGVLKNNETANWWIGVDPAYSNDFFAISIFKEIDGVYTQTYNYYKKGVDLTDMQDMCEDIIEHYLPIGLQLMQIDGNGLGVQLSNYLKKRYPEHVRVIRGNRIKLPDKSGTVSAKEFMHSNQIRLQYENKTKYIKDDIQTMHFSGWNMKYDFEIEDENTQDMGHGDTTIANALALLPRNMNLKTIHTPIFVGQKIEPEKNTETPNKMTWEEKLKSYKKITIKKGRGGRIY